MTVTHFDLHTPVPITKLGLMDYKVHYYHPTLDVTKKIWDLTPLLSQLVWVYDMNQAATEIRITLSHHDSIKNIIHNGGLLFIYGNAIRADGEVKFDEILRAVVFNKTLQTVGDSSQMEITAYDHAIYLTKNEESKKFIDKKASEIILELATEFGFDIGTIEDTGYKIPRLIFRKNNLWDMMIIALSETRWVDGQRFVLRMEKGKLNLYRKQLPPQVFVLSYGKNIYNSVYRESIQNIRNKVKLYTSGEGDNPLGDISDSETGDGSEDNDNLTILVGGDDAPVQNAKMITDYGLMQHIETGVTPKRYTDAKSYAEHLLEHLSRIEKTADVSAPNLNTIRWGDPIYIYEPLSGLAAQFYVQGGHHTVTANDSRMELRVQFEDLLPEQLFEQFENVTGPTSNPLGDISDSESVTPRKPARRRTESGELTRYVVPLDDPYNITQEYAVGVNKGYNKAAGHTGIDLANGSGDSAFGKPVYAAGAGTVVTAGDTGGLGGVMVVIDHTDGYRTIYAHLNVYNVRAGQKVLRGQLIGQVGETGSASRRVNPQGGPHLHFEVQRDRIIVNPREIVDDIHT